MASEPVRPTRLAGLAALAVLAAVCSPGAAAAESPRLYIFQCDLNGKKLTSDRLIPACSNVEQRQLNADGSVNRIIPPTPTITELEGIEQSKRDADAERAARNDAIRRDRNLMQRFPNEAEHRKARAKALDDLRNSVKNLEARIALLKAERKPLLDELEFYPPPKVAPNKLKLALDANDASLEAQRALVQNQTAEVVRINALYDAELARLKKLWGGVQPGSLGPLPGPQAAPLPANLKTSGP
jgi:uncharacterized small protein (DUF1192 family)